MSSDIAERTITAEEAERTIADLLREVAGGMTVHVERDGIEICTIAPPPDLRRRSISDILESLKGKPEVTLDDEFGKDLEEVINRKRPRRELPPWD